MLPMWGTEAHTGWAVFIDFCPKQFLFIIHEIEDYIYTITPILNTNLGLDACMVQYAMLCAAPKAALGKTPCRTVKNGDSKNSQEAGQLFL